MQKAKRKEQPKAHKSGNVLKSIALILVIVILAGVIGGSVYLGTQTKWYTDWSIFNAQKAPIEKPADDDGKKEQEVDSGETDEAGADEQQAEKEAQDQEQIPVEQADGE